MSTLAEFLAPDGIGKMRVVAIPRNDVPVNVGNTVAQTGDVDLVRFHYFQQRLLHREHDAHQPLALSRLEVGRFLYVPVPDDAAQSGYGLYKRRT